MFKKKVKVSSISDSSKYFEADFWVDSGALYSLIPNNLLESIDFEPEATKNILLADGRTERKLFGHCRFEIEGIEEKMLCPVIAGSNDSIFLLGATALENLLLRLIPLQKLYIRYLQ